MRLFLAFICLALLWTNGLPWLAMALVATAAILAALSWALSPLVRWLESRVD
jgi:hypothetical protein